MKPLIKKIKPKHALLLILLLTAFLRLYRLDYPDKYVFDEVYHAFTAREMLSGNTAAWEWWNTPPPGVAYEWTHPPLAKMIMAGSMFVLSSENGWAWRLPGVLLGIFSVYLIYLIGINLLKSQTSALIAAFIFSLDGLNFVQSRIGMNDIYYITFFLLSLLFILKKRYFFSAVFFGLALASKWAAIYGLLILMPLAIKDRQFLKILFFLTIPPAVYFLSYLPFFFSGHSIDQFKMLQQQMWWYHTNLKATHAYSSLWWSWPLNLYPVWYFVDYQKNAVANMFSSGNPTLFWLGSAALILTFIETVKKRVFNLTIIVLGFAAFWLPWSLSPRIMFLYHFSPSVPFLSLALAHQLSKLTINKKGKMLAIFLLILIVLTFVFLFPFLTGIALPKDFINFFFATNLSKNPF